MSLSSFGLKSLQSSVVCSFSCLLTRVKGKFTLWFHIRACYNDITAVNAHKNCQSWQVWRPGKHTSNTVLFGTSSWAKLHGNARTLAWYRYDFPRNIQLKQRKDPAATSWNARLRKIIVPSPVFIIAFHILSLNK